MNALVRSQLKRAVPAALLLGLVLGAVIGLLAGWLVWPVSWYDTDPSDLRLQHQIAYVAMTADSYALTGDVEAARSRLYELLDEDTSWAQVANLVARVAVAMENEGDAAAAQRIREMFNDVGMPSPAEEEFLAGPSHAIQPSAWYGLAALVLVAVGAAIWLARSMQPVSVTALIELPPEAVTGSAEEHIAAPPPYKEAGKEHIEEDISGERATEEEGASKIGLSVAPTEEMPPQSDVASREEAPAPQGEGQAPAGERDLGGALGVFEAEYRLGDRDFDCSFSIESEDGVFLGECGVGVAGTLSAEESRNVEAVELWLFDKADISTVSKLLVTEGAWADESIRQRLSAKGDLVVAHPGTLVSLRTHSLEVLATVRSCGSISEGSAPAAYFEHLKVEMVARRAGQGSEQG